MSQTPKISRILVPTDFSPSSQIAGRLAARLAHYLKAETVLFHAISAMDLLQEVGRARGKAQAEVINDVGDRLRSWFEMLMPGEVRGVLPVQVTVVVGEPAPAIVRAADESGADMVVMATHGRTGLAHLLMGSVTQTVLRNISVPVLALRLGQGDPPLNTVERLLWATDLSPVSERARGYALALADALGAEVMFLHVVPPSDLPWVGEEPVPTPGSWLEQHLAVLDRELERRQQQAEELGLRVRRKVLVGVPAERIAAEAQAEETHLIVMGTRGRTGLAHVLLGSVAQAVIRQAPCPVLAVQVRPER